MADPDATAWVLAGPDDAPDVTDGRLPRLLLPPTCYSQTAMSYMVKCHDRRGKFNAPAAVALGVEKRNFKYLAAGQSVTSTDGKTVTPDMVLGDPLPGSGIIVADVPSPDFVEAFMRRPEWKSKELMSHMVIMYWILGPALSSDSRILAFIHTHAHIKHVFCADDTCPNMVTHPGAAELLVKLRRIDPARFPLCEFDNSVSYPAPDEPSPLQLGRAGSTTTLMPRVINDTKPPAPFPDLLAPASDVAQNCLDLAAAAKAASEDPAFLARVEAEDGDLPNRDAEIIPLGTGSSVPSKYRNVSATLIRVPGLGAYLLDCGEGTLGQIRRALGRQESIQVLRQLRCIVISHLHADHHLGVVSVIRAWYSRCLADESSSSSSSSSPHSSTSPKTLAISCISRYRTMLQELSQVEDFGFHRLRFPNCSPTQGYRDRDVVNTDLDPTWSIQSITRIPVNHCWRSHATQLELTSGLRIAYSGDCRPCPAFASSCRGAHLLVHECTFGDDPSMQAHAVAKKHSTLEEALQVAREMGASRTLLTHFSQRYVKASCLKTTSSSSTCGGDDDEHRQNVIMAYDMMRVKLGQFQQAACFVPAVQALMESLGTHD
ncbi:hypothetical protein XA68_17775 [Ophiocordyceps unilateralis]|uniref:ribonuclease Z n=1 Tax=Ophiocordyceps unilateralis TaxID=268505 RepID=A0A2A9PQM7_OPHUN|nr:hypothetical protein XA68_17775 [Ophiocordyceps unilateralis]